MLMKYFHVWQLIDTATMRNKLWWLRFDDCVIGAVLTDLSKAFDYISHDLIIWKMAAYCLDFNDLKLIISYMVGGNMLR